MSKSPLSSSLKVFFTGHWSSKDIHVSRKKSSRIIDPSLEKKALLSWQIMMQRAKAQGSKLWDSDVYRFEESKAKGKELNLVFSVIPFSIRLGMNELTPEIKDLGYDFASRGIFSSCLIRTNDSKYVFIEKSSKYYTQKKYAYVGGVLSQSEYSLQTGEDLFFSVKKEISEELGISETEISSMFLRLGYLTENWNVCFLFEALINKSSKELANLFIVHNDGEAQAVVFIESENLQKKINIFEPKDQAKFMLLNLA